MEPIEWGVKGWGDELEVRTPEPPRARGERETEAERRAKKKQADRLLDKLLRSSARAAPVREAQQENE